MNIHDYLQTELHYSNFQIKVLRYFFYTVGAELSKLFLFGIYFFYSGKFQEYLFAVTILWYFRFFGGGFHLKTYWGCFLFSFGYLSFCINGMEFIKLPKTLQLIFLLFAIFLSKWTGSIPSALKKNVSLKQKYFYGKLQTASIILYFFLSIILPQNRFLRIGFWVIMIHILQLFFLRIKEVKIHDQKKKIYH